MSLPPTVDNLLDNDANRILNARGHSQTDRRDVKRADYGGTRKSFADDPSISTAIDVAAPDTFPTFVLQKTRKWYDPAQTRTRHVSILSSGACA